MDGVTTDEPMCQRSQYMGHERGPEGTLTQRPAVHCGRSTDLSMNARAGLIRMAAMISTTASILASLFTVSSSLMETRPGHEGLTRRDRSMTGRYRPDRGPGPLRSSLPALTRTPTPASAPGTTTNAVRWLSRLVAAARLLADYPRRRCGGATVQLAQAASLRLLACPAEGDIALDTASIDRAAPRQSQPASVRHSWHRRLPCDPSLWLWHR